MPKPTGPQWVQLYRGLAGVTPETLEVDRLGRHWSTNEKVAQAFATDGLGSEEPSMVIGALVHPRHIIPEDSEEWWEQAASHGAEGHDSPEREHTVRPGAPVHITSITHYPNDTDEHTVHRRDIPFSKLRKYRA